MSATAELIETVKTDIRALLTVCHQAADAPDPELEELDAAYDQLFDVMDRLEGDTAADSETDDSDITKIGEDALQLLDRLAVTFNRLGPPVGKEAMVRLAINLGLWIARHDGLIEELEPVVDALAIAANNTRDQQELVALEGVIGEIIDAVPPVVSQDLEKNNPGRPWRVLLMNYSIVATRSHMPELMERAFKLLTGKLPEDAPQFFSEGMQQMETLNYPPHVREVMEKYHRQWSMDRSLH